MNHKSSCFKSKPVFYYDIRQKKLYLRGYLTLKVYLKLKLNIIVWNFKKIEQTNEQISSNTGFRMVSDMDEFIGPFQLKPKKSIQIKLYTKTITF